jgi:diadenosine tetraphosphate (Ap4A) HIT family hydrolase
MCELGRAAETPYGIRVMAGEFADSYLATRGPQRGYVVVIWHGRHVAEPTDLAADEASGYWADVLRVGRAVQAHFGARKVNYETLGNAVPHLHTHVTARHAQGDVRPGAPLEHAWVEQPTEELRRDARALGELLGVGGPARGGRDPHRSPCHGPRANEGR